MEGVLQVLFVRIFLWDFELEFGTCFHGRSTYKRYVRNENVETTNTCHTNAQTQYDTNNSAMGPL